MAAKAGFLNWWKGNKGGTGFSMNSVHTKHSFLQILTFCLLPYQMFTFIFV